MEWDVLWAGKSYTTFKLGSQSQSESFINGDDKACPRELASGGDVERECWRLPVVEWAGSLGFFHQLCLFPEGIACFVDKFFSLVLLHPICP